MSFKHYAVPITLGILLGILQNTSLGIVLGIKPNSILVLAIVFSLFAESILQYAIVLFTAVVMVQFAVFETSIASALAMVGLLVYLFREALPGKMWLNSIGTTVLGTLAFYVLVDAGFIIQEPGTLFREIVVNSGLAIVLYLVLEKLLTSHEKTFTYSI
ncbi:MAG: hypothetical protein COU08_02690 [Candidatus Harrisonbacteria bacterium CG10_big_fil_rev_8_21_14_0_10_42_17]|uniref:Rod shape-determining protein MreD n=1 Tax=Candidatus Harrisonbacteria bacterium CG10_big_fil_rev_8_21_14_0_10_42_17 TaxID=1974584 RepID=A0A2M6WHW0_9BACT|nr:MAG: hypothetical protein COU08_02690 [Candidatus Harrisonbacteria bacterium CG10_big_fil_rev_8_21_14_0_10_42_17]